MSAKATCLFVLSGEKRGNSAQSFIHSFTLLHSSFLVQISTPEGKPVDFSDIDDHSRRWLSEFKSKSTSTPLNLSSIDPNRYTSLVIPHCPGAARDLYNNEDLVYIFENFITEKKPICAIGMGVAALCGATHPKTSKWLFKSYAVTGPSVFELACSPEFKDLPVIPEDVLKEKGASYTSTQNNELHVVIDRNLITGQNEQSTLTSIQNLILKCSKK